MATMREMCWEIRPVVLALGIYMAFISIGAAGGADNEAAHSVPGGGIAMIETAGTPREVGRQFGERHGERLRIGMTRWPSQKQMSREKILASARPMIDIVGKIAPHWLEEASAVAEAAKIDADLYIARMFVLEPQDDCTTYILSGARIRGGMTFFHRTRDNTPGSQTGALWDIAAPGVYKFMAVTYTTSRSLSVMVNEKRLAASADMGGPRDPQPRHVGMMNGLMLRHIAERAADVNESLDIVKQFVKNGWYTRGKPQGTVWTFADRHGNIITASHHSGADSVSLRHIEADYYTTRGGARQIEALEPPVSFVSFRNVSRDPNAKIAQGKNSIAGMTIRIHPEYPEYLTCAWFSFPAVSLAFPLYMGGAKTPLPLLDGSLYKLCAELPKDYAAWEELERNLLEESSAMEAQALTLIKQNRIREVQHLIDEWTRDITAKHLEFLRASSTQTHE